MAATILERVSAAFQGRTTKRANDWAGLVKDVSSGKLKDAVAIADSLAEHGRTADELAEAVANVEALTAARAGLASLPKLEADRLAATKDAAKARADYDATVARHEAELVAARSAWRDASDKVSRLDYQIRENRESWQDITRRYRDDGSVVSVAEVRAADEAEQAQQEQRARANRQHSAELMERKAGLLRELSAVQTAPWSAAVVDERTGIRHGSATDWRPGRIAEIEAKLAAVDAQIDELVAG